MLSVFTAGCVCALTLVAAASAREERGGGTIEPSTRVNGMLVVQGRAQRADTTIFGYYCDAVVLESGRFARTCRRIPHVSRLFVGYGIFTAPRAIEREWKTSKWEMWIDGQHVNLAAFGTTDRTLAKYPPANGKDVTLREWSVTLVKPTPGRHTIRYRIRWPTSTIDTTWAFAVAAK
jgi:hypothetical protein